MHLHYHQVLGLFSLLVLLPSFISAISYCGGPCNNLNDCNGQLICIGGKCKDDPDIGSHICGGSGGGGTPSPSGGTCKPSGEASCNSQSKPTYTCSPPITYPSTSAKLKNNDFSKGGDGGGASECDNSYHSNSERVVALSTGWYANGSRCGKMIRITASNGRTSIAKVVDECDSRNGGCDADHSFQGPCDNNIVDASNAVWQDLGLNTDIGVVDITWSMA